MIRTKLLELSKQLSKQKKGSNRYKMLKSQMEELILPELMKSDVKVKRLIQENRELLVSQNLKFKVYREGGSVVGTHATELRGSMHKNGFVYIEASKMMLPFIPFSKSMYPIKFDGMISWDGSIELKVSQRNLQLYGSQVPSEFIGNIEEGGNVKIAMIKSSFEWSGEHYIHKLLFDPFKGDESKRRRFIENTVSVKARIQSYLEE